MKKLIVSLLIITTTSSVGYCYCNGLAGGPEYERCREQERMFEVQKQMLQQQEMQTRLLQQQQLQQQYQYQRQQADALKYGMQTYSNNYNRYSY